MGSFGGFGQRALIHPTRTSSKSAEGANLRILPLELSITCDLEDFNF